MGRGAHGREWECGRCRLLAWEAGFEVEVHGCYFLCLFGGGIWLLPWKHQSIHLPVSVLPHHVQRGRVEPRLQPSPDLRVPNHTDSEIAVVAASAARHWARKGDGGVGVGVGPGAAAGPGPVGTAHFVHRVAEARVVGAGRCVVPAGGPDEPRAVHDG